MLPWIQLDSATIPGENGELRLKQRGSEFSIMLGANELMNSRLSGSRKRWRPFPGIASSRTRSQGS